MQHERDKRRKDLVKVPDKVVLHGRPRQVPEPGTFDRKSAVEYLEEEIQWLQEEARANSEDVNELEVTLPMEVAKLVLECAEAGKRKGQGRKGRPPDKDLVEAQNAWVVEWARERKADLVHDGMKATGANSAHDQAAEEASTLAYKLFGLNLSVGTIRRRMQSEKD
jgi:hypothetical protein